jgi:cell wall-associated NlpC family hydrolase
MTTIPTSIKRADIVAAARSYIGVPFVHQGRTKVHGLDCLGLIWAVAKDVGYDYQMRNDYTPAPHSDLLVNGVNAALVKPARQGVSKLMPGDIILSWIAAPGQPQHFAMIGELFGQLSIIHAFQKVGYVTETRLVDFWAKHYVSTHNYPNTENLEGVVK